MPENLVNPQEEKPSISSAEDLEKNVEKTYQGFCNNPIIWDYKKNIQTLDPALFGYEISKAPEPDAPDEPWDYEIGCDCSECKKFAAEKSVNLPETTADPESWPPIKSKKSNPWKDYRKKLDESKKNQKSEKPNNLNNLFKRGDKFKLKKSVSFEDLLELGFGEEESEWILNQEFLVCSRSQIPFSKNIYFFYDMAGGDCCIYFDMVEKLDSPLRGHGLTKVFSDKWQPGRIGQKD